MKRKIVTVFASLLVITALAALIPFCVSAELVTVYEPKDNVALGKTYTASAAYAPTPATMGYHSIDGKELTDGVLHTNDLYGTCWHGFDYRIEEPMYATVDLGAVTDGLIQFSMQFVNQGNSGIDAPSTLVFLVSEDGVNYTEIGSGKTKSTELTAFHTLKLKTPVKARYVKAAIGRPLSGVFVFCSEFEIYNSTEVQKEASELSEEESEEVSEEIKTGTVETGSLDTTAYPIRFRDGSRFTIADGYLLGVTADDTPSSILRDLVTVAGIRINGVDGKEITAGAVSTGCTLAQYKDKKVETEYTVVIPGDIDGKSGIGDGDKAAVRKVLFGADKPENAYLSAADFDGNGDVNITDYISLSLVKEGLVSSASVSIPEQYDMKFKKSSSQLYTMSCTAANGKPMTLTFDLKSWGVWNIGSFTVGGVRLAGGGTDWEYVYRAAPSSSAQWVWSGGNHGNETLVSIDFFDGSTGEPIDVSVTGKETIIKNLLIVEKTTLHWGEADNFYCNVIRKYTVVGQKITLDVSYDFVKDCYYEKSYTCMFPVPKTVGLYADYLNDDGTYAKIVSLEVGAADYSGPFYGKLASSACLIYGDKYPDYSFLVQIYTKNDSVENFKNPDKLMYWDMNRDTNKLYFTKFLDGTRTKVTAGTHWDTSCSWTLLIDTPEA